MALVLLALPHAINSQPLAAQDAAPPAPAFPRGSITESVACAADPEQTYALFLPSAYSPDRPWPVLYAFDPAARGSVPVELVRDAAEKHGYIVVGSNNSQNGPAEPQMQAAQAVWRDTHERLAIDPHRVYFTGFSGGARFATYLAIMCNCAAGVISHGAGFPEGKLLEAPIKFSYFAAVGHLDFNYPEVIDVANHLDADGSSNRLRRFQGDHDWAPAEVWEEALRWMELRAAKQGYGNGDSGFVGRQFDRATQRAAKLEEAGDVYGAAYEYRKLALDFSGLADTSEYVRKAEELAAGEAFRRAEKQERDDIERQRRIVGEFLYYLDALSANPSYRQEALFQLRRLSAEWKGHLSDGDNAETEVVLRRALRGVFALSYEAGLRALRENEPTVAVGQFEVAAEIVTRSPMPLFQLARAHALGGNTKEAIRALRKAVDKGFKYPELLREAAEFAALKENKDFREILEKLQQ